MWEDISLQATGLTDAEQDNIKEQEIADTQWNKSVALEMNTLNETDNTLKQSNNDCIKPPATENEYNKLETCHHQI